MDQTISLNKFISDTGYCSRREADELIRQGRVLLNDRPARAGNRYSPGDQVEVDGSIITPDKKEKPVYIAFNKPLGITTTSEEHIRGNIISFINYPKRIFPIGRLDKDSEGLIFLTNDGDIVNKLLRAGNEHEKEYVVRVNKPLAPGFAEKMSAGLPIMGTVTLPCKVHVTGRQTFRIVLTQGLNRQIRKMCEYMGYTVMQLQRVRIMHVQLDKLPTGKWRYLSDTEISRLKDSIRHSTGTAPAGKTAAAKRNVRPAATHTPAKEPKKAAAVPKSPSKKVAKPEKPAKKTGAYKAFRQKGRQR